MCAPANRKIAPHTVGDKLEAQVALIDEAAAAGVTPESAADVIERAPWSLIGGSFYGGEARRRVDHRPRAGRRCS